MSTQKASAIAHPNIALIKYWGNREQGLRLPANGSISMNLAALETRTSVRLRADKQTDLLFINDKAQHGSALARVQEFMRLLRELSGQPYFAEVRSHNNFPSSAGIASSAAAFGALALSGAHAYGLELAEKDLSRLARRGSGSACRSIPPGFTEWQVGSGDADSYAISIAPPDHWELWDCVALVQTAAKSTGSSEGHALAVTSPLQTARVADTPRRLKVCRQAVLSKDFECLAKVIELDSHMMHAIMQTSQPALLYWQPASLLVMQSVTEMRRQGLEAASTLDAGPNVHVICTAAALESVRQHLAGLPGVLQVLASPVGGAARLIEGQPN